MNKFYTHEFFSSVYRIYSWTIKKAEHRRIDAFELWCWRRFLRVPWTARKSNQSILKEISFGCSMEHYFTSVWGECNCVVVWAFFGIALWRADCVIFMLREDLILCGLIYGPHFICMQVYTHHLSSFFFLSSFFEKTTVLKSCCRTAKDARILGLLRRIQSGARDEAWLLRAFVSQSFIKV